MQQLSDKPAFFIGGVGSLLFVLLVVFAGIIAVTAHPLLVPVAVVAGFLILNGFVVLSPNEAKVLTFFGKYVGTLRYNGFGFTIPFTWRRTVPLKYRNFVTATLKVNDARGNPIDIGAVVVWRVVDAAKACFNVDDYAQFVANQSESALRATSAKYPYDDADGRPSLRNHAEEIVTELVQDLQEKLSIAGVQIEDVKIAHLSYSAEISAAMLRRQQAEAIMQARKYLVQNAMLMVEDVIAHLENKGMALDTAQKMTLVNNLLVVLSGDHEASPVLNVG